MVLEGVTDRLVRGALGQDGLYTLPSYPRWVGMRLVDVDAAGVVESEEPSGMTASLSEDLDVDTIDPASGEVPALLTGTLENARRRSSVAVVLNGYVVALSPIFRAERTPSFAAIVPDGAFQRGGNELALYELVPGKQPVLRRITLVQE